MSSLTTPLSQVVGVGPTLLTYLQKHNLSTVADLLLTLPLHYSDLSATYQIKDLAGLTDATSKVTITATVESLSRMKAKRGLRARLRDASGTVTAIWFNSTFMLRSLKVGQTYVLSGVYNPTYQTLTQPVFEPADRAIKLHTGRLVPVYTGTLGIKQGTLRRLLHSILTDLDRIPITVNASAQLTDWASVFRQLHFPDQAELTIQAREILAQEELLSLSTQAKQLKDEWLKLRAANQVPFNPQTYTADLPFMLTLDQTQALTQIAHDLTKSHPMNRLLMGDVGSGKTIVAAIALVAAVTQGDCACLVAPTRILAEQHLKTISDFFPQVPIELVTGTTKFSPQRLSSLRRSLVIATHAVLPHLTQLKPVLVVIDEQQRFGVTQRSLWSSANFSQTQPHLLTMTATPIPRSLMLTVFSHLQLSVLDQLPVGRVPTKTWFVPAAKRHSAWLWIQQHLAQNPTSLCLVVCPFIDPSQAQSLENVKAVSAEYDRLKKLLPSTLSLALLHARLTKKQQQSIIDQLNQQKIQVLVSTPMIEVGVDLPTADIMVVEAAERFGLSSLHQLRGRVGRRGQQGFCLVFHSSDQADERLRQFCQLKTGQQVAELDLKTRGAGDLFGVEQSGFTALRFGLWSNFQLLAKVQKALTQLPPDWHSPLFPDQPLDKKADPN